ncbi:uncharacterized protein LOC143280002 [Babylonia areolata]|uniref:uncharacterized protein LOC143280002 n=1 Tax=Babylonia areolata TaxID=304850 RepID=UPI003FD525FF
MSAHCDNGPRCDKGWMCLAGDLPCFRDCCRRGTQFCNHRLQRCQECQIWKKFCGNQTLTPWECDLYCSKLQGGVETDQVSPVYMDTTFTLGAAFFLLVVVVFALLLWKRRSQQSSATGSEQFSLVESGRSQDEEDAFPTRTDQGTGGTPPTTEPPEQQGGDDATMGPEATPPPSSPPPPPPPPPHIPAANGHVSNVQQPEGEAGGSHQVHHHHLPRECRDRRLDMISPTTDTGDHIVQILTSGANYGGGPHHTGSG